MTRDLNDNELSSIRKQILRYFEELGFTVNPHLKPKTMDKSFLRNIHQKRKIETLQKYRKFIKEGYSLVRKYYGEKIVIDVDNINLKIKFINKISTPDEYLLFKWWNLVWWSMPYEKSVGRRINYILFDEGNGYPFGLVVLQSPVMYCKARDQYLGIKKENRDYWINQALYGQRVGALPPYNMMYGGKMVAMSLVSSEIRQEYRRKYKNMISSKKKRKIPPRLLFVYTLSAYGRSKIYEDLKYNSDNLSIFVGYSTGAGTFHIPDDIYHKLLHILGENIDTSVFTSPSRKMKLVSKALRIIGLPNFEYHNIKRGVYIFPHVYNLRQVINGCEKPKWKKLNINKLFLNWVENYLQMCDKRKIEISFSDIIKLCNVDIK